MCAKCQVFSCFYGFNCKNEFSVLIHYLFSYKGSRDSISMQCKPREIEYIMDSLSNGCRPVLLLYKE